MALGDGGLVFEARTLAQGHPLTPLAKRYVDRAVAEQRLSQPITEIGIWAGYALTNGYCLRRVEENAAGLVLAAAEGADTDLDRLDEEAGRVAAELRGADAGRHILGEEEETIAALDQIIAGEVERRLDHWRDSVDEKAWAELEEYITWWAVKGYALRVAEMSMGALT
ncbi:MAG: hypothetical protein M3396_04815 [Actinomycetota bacterium]|nr:hypothetical protein [Actinomycetota bacterium]MDQ3575527.1 hypothetical protein [Actinomycetota bacterium]